MKTMFETWSTPALIAFARETRIDGNVQRGILMSGPPSGIDGLHDIIHELANRLANVASVRKIAQAENSADSELRRAMQLWLVDHPETKGNRLVERLQARLIELRSMHVSHFPENDACIDCIIFNGEGEYERRVRERAL